MFCNPLECVIVILFLKLGDSLMHVDEDFIVYTPKGGTKQWFENVKKVLVPYENWTCVKSNILSMFGPIIPSN